MNGKLPSHTIELSRLIVLLWWCPPRKTECDADGVSWTAGGRTGDGPQGPVTWKSITPVGIIDSRYFLQRLLLYVHTNLKRDCYQSNSLLESSNYPVQAGRSSTIVGRIPFPETPTLTSWSSKALESSKAFPF